MTIVDTHLEARGPHIDKARWGWVWNVAAQAAGVPPAAMVSNSRAKGWSQARQGLYMFMHEEGWSFAAIGRFCNRDHTTVRHSVVNRRAQPDGIADRVRAALREERARHKAMPDDLPPNPPQPEPKSTPAPVLDTGTVFRVRFDPGHGEQSKRNICPPHYSIEPAANGKALPVRRPPLTPGQTALFGDIEPIVGAQYYRAESLPGIGATVLFPASQDDWQRAAGINTI